MATLKVTNIKNESFAGDQLYLKSNGYLGIGTTNPGEELEVSADAPSIQLLSTNASGRKYGFQSMNDGKFGIYDGTAGVNRIVLASDGKVGIGTASPDRTLEVQNDNSYAAKFGGAGGGSDFAIEIGQTGNSGSPGFNAVAGSMVFQLAGSEKARFNGSTGNFGINNNSPDRKLEVQNDSDYAAKFSGGSGAGHTSIEIGQTALNGSAGFNATGGSMLFDMAGAEKMRLDSSGRLLIGTTTAGASGVDDLIVNVSSGNGGMTIRTGAANNGNLYFSDGTSGAAEYKGYLQYRHGTDILVLGAAATEKAHVTSEGLVAFSGNGAGASSGYALKVMGGTNHKDYPGIYMEGSTGADNSSIWAKYNLTLGCDSTDGIAGRQVAFSNGGDQIAAFSIDGLLFGSDSAAANALDDYEEGTWTGGIQDFSATYTSQYGYYTKVGNLVTATVMMAGSGAPGSGNMKLTSLPFTCSNSTNYRAVGSFFCWTGFVTGGLQIVGSMSNNTNFVNILGNNNNGNATHINRSALNSNGWEFQLTISYHV
jgi:hypothetical protein